MAAAGGTAPGAPVYAPRGTPLEDGAAAPDDEQSLQKILLLIRSLSGLDLREYKPETIRRRRYAATSCARCTRTFSSASRDFP